MLTHLCSVFDNLPRLQAHNYRITNQDAVRLRNQTSGIVESTFQMDRHRFRLMDVGGQRQERHKWIQCFTGAPPYPTLLPPSQPTHMHIPYLCSLDFLHNRGACKINPAHYTLYADVTAIIWMVATSGFDQVIREDSKTVSSFTFVLLPLGQSIAVFGKEARGVGGGREV